MDQPKKMGAKHAFTFDQLFAILNTSGFFLCVLILEIKIKRAAPKNTDENLIVTLGFIK